MMMKSENLKIRKSWYLRFYLTKKQTTYREKLFCNSSPPRSCWADGFVISRHFKSYFFVSRAVSLSDTPRSSSWWRWIPLVKLLMLEKKLDEKYFFVMEKFDFDFLFMTFFFDQKFLEQNIFHDFFWNFSNKITKKIQKFYFKNALEKNTFLK